MSDFIIGYARGSSIKGVINLKEKGENLAGRWCLYEGELGVDLAKIVCLGCGGSEVLPQKSLGRMIRLINDEDVLKIKNIRRL
ncbi:MAG: hypothetical protein CEN92_322, partial [Candidatus Berkelbacteria bacterium Licking1014_96]